jgi:hypothetical protein
MKVFCLRPIKPDHESWPASCVRSEIEWAKVWASNSEEARRRVARATDVQESELPTKAAKDNQKFAKKRYWDSPWEIPEVTSCELDMSGRKPGDHVLLDHVLLSDGRELPLKMM